MRILLDENVAGIEGNSTAFWITMASLPIVVTCRLSFQVSLDIRSWCIAKMYSSTWHSWSGLHQHER